MLKKTVLIASLLLATIVLAQEKTPPGPGNAVYRLEFTIMETDGAKKISSKTYTIMVGDSKRGRMRVGSRLPISSGSSGGFQYFDVGVNIDASANWVDPTSVRLNVTYEITAVASAERSSTMPPVVRNLNDSMEATIPLDKPVIITSQDEPGSSTTFQMQVVAKLVK